MTESESHHFFVQLEEGRKAGMVETHEGCKWNPVFKCFLTDRSNNSRMIINFATLLQTACHPSSTSSSAQESFESLSSFKPLPSSFDITSDV
jgi:hypothetical protein